MRLLPIIALLLLAGTAQGNDLQVLLERHPYTRSLPSDYTTDVSSAKVGDFSVDHFRMSELRTTRVRDLVKARGVPDLLCESADHGNCILIYKLGSGHRILFFVPSLEVGVFTAGFVYDASGSWTGEVIK